MFRLTNYRAIKSEAIVRAWSGERGAGSEDFESGEQEVLSDFLKYRKSSKNRNFDGYFSQKKLFLVKFGTYYRGCRRPFNPLQWQILSNFFWSIEFYSIQ
jgi:restriction endonuclease S subunit